MAKSTISQSQPPTNGQSVLSGTPLTPEFDINEFRIDQTFGLHTPAQRKAIVVPVARPDRQQWVCVHPDPSWRIAINLFEDKVNRRTYLVGRDIAPEVTQDLVPKLLVAYVTRTGAPGLWPIRLPDDSGRIDTFNESAMAIVLEYAGQWIRVLSDQAEKCYSIMQSPPMDLPAPKWPDGGFKWMYETAFKNRVIRSLDHPVLVSLRGGVLGA